MTIAGRVSPFARSVFVFVALLSRVNGQSTKTDSSTTPPTGSNSGLFATGFESLFTNRAVNIERGLPSNDVRSIAQSEDGWLWIATRRGIARFDGRSLGVVPTTDASTADGECNLLLCDRTDRIWAAFDGELRRRDDSQWKVVPLPTAGGDRLVRSMAEARDGSIWCALGAALVRVGRDDRVETVEPPARESSDHSPWRVVADSTRAIHVQCESTVARRDGEAWTTLATRGQGERFQGLASARRGGVWLADDHFVRRLVDGRSEDRTDLLVPLSNGPVELLDDRCGRLWIGHAKLGIGFVFPDRNGCPRLAQGDSYPSSCARTLFEDRDGVVHVGTPDRGDWMLTPQIFLTSEGFTAATNGGEATAHLAPTMPSTLKRVDCLAATDQGDLLVASDLGNVTAAVVEERYGVDKIQFPVLSQLPRAEERVLSATQSRDGAIWIGTSSGGLWRQEPASRDRTQETTPPTCCFTAEQVGHDVVALIADAESVLAASERGVFRCQEGRLEPIELGCDPATARMRDLSRAPDGTVWGAGDGGLFRFDGRAFRRVERREKSKDVSARPLRAFRGVTAQLGVAFAPEPGGVSAVRLGAEPLDSVCFTTTTATDALADDAGHLWLNSERGLERYRIDEVDACLRKAELLRPVHESVNDGAPKQSLLGTASHRAARTSKGWFVFAGDRGVVFFDPRAVTSPPTVKVCLESASFDDKVEHHLDRRADRVEIPPGEHRVQLGLSIPTTRWEDQVELAYRVAGEERWTSVGSRHDVEFFSLEPGPHVFELRARIGDGPWSEQPTRVELDLLPFFWQTLWFKSAVALAVAAAIVLAMRARHQAVLVRERERAAAAERFAAEKSRSDALLEATEEFVCFADADERVVSVNEAGRRILGDVDDTRLRSLRLADLFAAGARATVEGEALPALRTSELWSRECELAAADGTPIRALCTLRVHRRADGALDHYSLVASDLTERVETERVRRRLESELRQAQKLEAIGTLAGGIAHDFNNLLTAILGHAELAREALPRDPRSVLEGLDEILEASGRARDLVRQILRFSRRSEHQRSITTLFAPVQEACRLLHSTLPASIQLVVDLKAQDETVMADPTEIHQCVVNLGTNAAHAVANGSGRIDVKLESVDATSELVASVTGLRVGRYVRLTVLDNGVGMTPQVLERAFDPFFTTKPMGEGTGLGLSLVHAIVTSHDGAIRVQSELGRGTRFDVYFPVVDAAVDAVEPVALEIPIGQGEELLVVDDERAVLDLSRRMLERLGYRVVALQSPSAALARFETSGSRFAALVTDLVMADLNGLQLARRLRARVPDLPVVLVTGYLAGLDQSDLATYGVDEIVAKPFTMRSIAEALRRVLDARRVRSST